MFYAKNLMWNDAAGTKAAGRGYDLDMDATKCVQHINATNGNHTWVTYVNTSVFSGERT